MPLTDASGRDVAAWNDHDPDALGRALVDGAPTKTPLRVVLWPVTRSRSTWPRWSQVSRTSTSTW